MLKRPKAPQKPTQAQLYALRSARDYGDPTYHLHGRSEHGGFTSTRSAMIRHGWLTPQDKITDAGCEVLRIYG